jgi:hypothetical protein
VIIQPFRRLGQEPGTPEQGDRTAAEQAEREVVARLVSGHGT